MRVVRTGALIGVATVAFTAAAVIVVNCASATTITLDIRTTAEACGTFHETGIAVTTTQKVSSPSESSLQDTQAGCTKNATFGEIGTLVVTPNGDKAGTIGVRVVAGLNGKSSSLCDNEYGEDTMVHDNCIIALRRVTFVEGANVPYVISLDPVCAAQSCPDGFTCTGVNGKPQCTGIPAASKTDDPPPVDGSTPPPIEAAPDMDTSYKDTGAPPDGNPCNDCPGTCTNGKTCIVNCADNAINCKVNVCKNPALDCVLQCNGPSACANARCLGTKGSCKFECGGNTGDNHCTNIACDASTCVVECKDTETSCQNVVVTGTTNTITCGLVGGRPSCNDVNCIPGQKPGTVCTRNCEGIEAGACGLKSECDAGSCTAFQVNDGGPPPEPAPAAVP